MTEPVSDRPFFQHPELDGSSFYWPDGPAGVLMLHGFTATTVEVRPLATVLHQNGFTVSAPLLPGHGTTPEDLNRQKWRNWVTIAEQAFEKLNGQCRSVVVAGESMGALLALHLAAKNPSIRGLLLYAPAIQIPGIRKSIVAAPFMPIRQKTYTSAKDPACFPWQGYTVIPVRAVTQLYRLQVHVRQLIAEVTQPVWLFQGLQDRTVDPQGAQYIHDNIRSLSKQLHWFPESGHCVLLDLDFDRIVDLSLGLINRVTTDE